MNCVLGGCEVNVRHCQCMHKASAIFVNTEGMLLCLRSEKLKRFNQAKRIWNFKSQIKKTEKRLYQLKI